MKRWGLSQLMNAEIPSFGTSRWKFLEGTKNWAKELQHREVRFWLSQGKCTHPLKLLLSLIQTTGKFLISVDHRVLFERLRACFACTHKVDLPYRLTLRMPLLTSDLMRSLRMNLEGVVDLYTDWPLPLHAYLKSRIHLVSASTNTLGCALKSREFDLLNSNFVHHKCASTCPCAQWQHLPGTGPGSSMGISCSGTLLYLGTWCRASMLRFLHRTYATL